jgi:xanthine/uracil/vitamin C permease (AzgA family)
MLPAFVTMVVMSHVVSITDGITFGFSAFVVLKLATDCRGDAFVSQKAAVGSCRSARS